MDEWVKISVSTVAGAIGGFLAGVALEPLRLKQQQRAQIRTIERSLYDELVHNYQIIEHGSRVIDHPDNIYPFDASGLLFIRYESAKDDILFPQIRHSSVIETTYGALIELKSKRGVNSYDCFDVRSKIDDYLARGQFDINLWRKLSYQEVGPRFPRYPRSRVSRLLRRLRILR